MSKELLDQLKEEALSEEATAEAFNTNFNSTTEYC